MTMEIIFVNYTSICKTYKSYNSMKITFIHICTYTLYKDI